MRPPPPFSRPDGRGFEQSAAHDSRSLLRQDLRCQTAIRGRGVYLMQKTIDTKETSFEWDLGGMVADDRDFPVLLCTDYD